MLVPSFRSRRWRRVRIVPVMGFTLTFVTARRDDLAPRGVPSRSRLRDGTRRGVGVAGRVPDHPGPARRRLPGAANVPADERERDVSEPLLPLTRGVLGAQAVAAAVLGAGLVLAPRTFDAAWPWPLPPLSAGAVGAWLLTIAAGSAWALHDGDWRAFRIAIPGLAAVRALRRPGDRRASRAARRRRRAGAAVRGGSAWSLLATAVAATVRQERRHASAVTVAPAQVR